LPNDGVRRNTPPVVPHIGIPAPFPTARVETGQIYPRRWKPWHPFS